MVFDFLSWFGQVIQLFFNQTNYSTVSISFCNIHGTMPCLKHKFRVSLNRLIINHVAKSQLISSKHMELRVINEASATHKSHRSVQIFSKVVPALQFYHLKCHLRANPFLLVNYSGACLIGKSARSHIEYLSASSSRVSTFLHV